MDTRRTDWHTLTQRLLSLLLALALCASLFLHQTNLTVHAQANEALAPFLRLTLMGDVAAAGVGLRGSGHGEITLDALPAGATVQRAFLYWATLGLSAAYTDPQLDGETLAGELIGTSADTCWFVPQGARNYVYRADVTGVVDGNGTYIISGLPDDRFAGNDSQGASLVVIYNQPGPQHTVMINDGAVTLDLNNLHTYTTVLGAYTPDQNDPPAHVIYLVGDGQSEFNDGEITFAGHVLDENVFIGADGEFWDTPRYDVTGLTGDTTSATTLDNRGQVTSPDCLLWVAAILSVQAEPLDRQVYLPVTLDAGSQ